MGGGVEGKTGCDLYGVLGLEKECTSTELRNAYKKLAMRWHPDRYSASGNSKFVMDEAKKKFQDIQEAYSVLSDSSKRLLYDVGAYDEDDDDNNNNNNNNNGMGEFLDEMITMMNQTNHTTTTTTVSEQQSTKQLRCSSLFVFFPNDFSRGFPNDSLNQQQNVKKNDTFEELQDLFDEMFNRDMMQTASTFASFSSSSSSSSEQNPCQSSSSSCGSSSLNNNNNSKRNSSHMTMSYEDHIHHQDYWTTGGGAASSSNNSTLFPSCFSLGIGGTAPTSSISSSSTSSQKKGSSSSRGGVYKKKNHHHH